MEAVKENQPEKTEEVKRKSKLIIVVGVDKISKQFMVEAISRIISMSGQSVNAIPFDLLDGKEVEEDFHVVMGGEFYGELETKASLIFASYRNPKEVIEEMKSDGLMISQEFEVAVERFHELAKWMRSSKLAYTMDYNAQVNEKGLHNYTTLRNIILPMNFAFQRETKDGLPMEKDLSNQMRFDRVNPQVLIEALVPQLKEESKKASEKFDEKVNKETNGIGLQDADI